MQLVDDLDWQDDSRENWKEEKTADKERILIKHEDNMQSVNQKTPKDLATRLDVSEPERSVGHHPVIVPINDFNNDIYFIGKQWKQNENCKRIIRFCQSTRLNVMFNIYFQPLWPVAVQLRCSL